MTENYLTQLTYPLVNTKNEGLLISSELDEINTPDHQMNVVGCICVIIYLFNRLAYLQLRQSVGPLKLWDPLKCGTSLFKC